MNNNLKQIMLAMHNYHDVYKHFPGNLTDNQGRKLLSWRVAILPFVDEKCSTMNSTRRLPGTARNNKRL